MQWRKDGNDLLPLRLIELSQVIESFFPVQRIIKKIE